MAETPGNAGKQPRSRVHKVEIKRQPRSYASYWLALLALAAVVVSLSQGELVKRHNSFSVRPLLDVEYDLNAEHEWSTVHLVNDGLGPAIVQWAEVRLDGRRPSNPDQLNGWPEIKATFPDTTPPPTHEFYIAEEVIAVAASKPLLRLPNLEKSIDGRDTNVNFFRRLEHLICYCSLYGECWTFRVRLPGDRRTTKGCHPDASGVPEIPFETPQVVSPPSDDAGVPPSAFPAQPAARPAPAFNQDPSEFKALTP